MKTTKRKLKKGVKVLLIAISLLAFIYLATISIKGTSETLNKCEKLGLTVRECQNLRG